VSKPERRSLRMLTALVTIAIVTLVSLFGFGGGHTVLSAVLITVLVGVVASSPVALVAWMLADDRNAGPADATS
jgi:uncharacterized membrane protein YccC